METKTNEGGNFAERQELILISAAVAFSVMLSIAANFSQRLFRARPHLEVIITGILTLACVSCGLAGLILLWLRRISLDVFDITLTGLLPAIQAGTKLRFHQLLAQARMRRNPALRNRIDEFRYLRFGRPPVLGQLHDGRASKATTYVRYTSQKHVHEKKGSMWYADVIDFDDTAVQLRNFYDLGDSTRWWRTVNNSINVVQEHQRLTHLQTQAQAVNALAAVSEIASVGEGVLLMHGEGIQKLVANNLGIRDGLKTTPASTCNAFLHSLGLARAHEWGTVDTMLRNAFVEELTVDANSSLPRARRYALLFYVLLHESRIFTTICSKDEAGRPLPSAEDVIDKFIHTAHEGARQRVTRRWLQRWRVELL